MGTVLKIYLGVSTGTLAWVLSVPSLREPFPTINAHIDLAAIIIAVRDDSRMNAGIEMLTVFAPRFTDRNGNTDLSGDNPVFDCITGLIPKVAFTNWKRNTDFRENISQFSFITAVSPFGTCLTQPHVADFEKLLLLNVEHYVLMKLAGDIVLPYIIFPTGALRIQGNELTPPWCSVAQDHDDVCLKCHSIHVCLYLSFQS